MTQQTAIQGGIVSHLLPLLERKKLAVSFLLCLGGYPKREVIMCKFNLSEHHVNEVISHVRKYGLKLNKEYSALMLAELKQGIN